MNPGIVIFFSIKIGVVYGRATRGPIVGGEGGNLCNRQSALLLSYRAYDRSAEQTGGSRPGGSSCCETMPLRVPDVRILPARRPEASSRAASAEYPSLISHLAGPAAFDFSGVSLLMT